MYYTKEQEEAIANFIKAFNALKKTKLDVVYYNQISGYTRIIRATEFIYEK